MSGPVLTCPGDPSDTGAYRISWKGPEGATYRLEENGKVLYQGPEQASTVTGRKAGAYSYRVGIVAPEGDGAGNWSASCRVEVSPPPLSMAFGLMSMGFVVFLAVLFIIIRGHRAHRRGTIG